MHGVVAGRRATVHARKRPLPRQFLAGFNLGGKARPLDRDALPQVIPLDAPAFIHGDRTLTWGVIIHMCFVVGALVLAFIDRMQAQTKLIGKGKAKEG